MPRTNNLTRGLLAALALSMMGAALFAQSGVLLKAWYTEDLKKLGFTVFPEPKDLENFVVNSLDGSPKTLSEQRGKIVLLNFWATWCPPCQAEMPAIEALWKTTKDKAFTVMGISVGEAPGTVKDYIGRKGYSYPIFVDPSGAIGSLFGARSIPTTYIVDKTGKAIAGIVGGAPYDRADALAIFTKLASR